MKIHVPGCWRAAMVVVRAGSALLAQQPPSQAALTEASAKLQARDYAGAVKILEGVTAGEPANARAWRMFGMALQQNGEFDRALEAYNKFLALQPGAPVITYNVGTVYARKGDAD